MKYLNPMKQTAVVFAMGVIAVLMTSASTRVFAQAPLNIPILNGNNVCGNNISVGVNNLLADNPGNSVCISSVNRADNAVRADENKIASEEHALSSEVNAAVQHGEVFDPHNEVGVTSHR